MFNFPDKVKDEITGFIGIVVKRAEWLNGCVRYALQGKKLKDGLPTDTEWFDSQQLSIVGKVKKTNVPDKPGHGIFKFEFRDEVKCEITGFIGIVVAKGAELSGDVDYGLQSVGLKDGLPIKIQWIDEIQLRIVKKAAKRPYKKPTEGPMPDPKKSRDPIG